MGCKYKLTGLYCQNHCEDDEMYCTEHAHVTCVVCGQHATHDCSKTATNCKAALCDNIMCILKHHYLEHTDFLFEINVLETLANSKVDMLVAKLADDKQLHIGILYPVSEVELVWIPSLPLYSEKETMEDIRQYLMFNIDTAIIINRNIYYINSEVSKLGSISDTLLKTGNFTIKFNT